MAEEKTYVFGDGNNNVPLAYALNGGYGNGIFGGNGGAWGGGLIGFILGILLGNNGNGFGGILGGGNGGTLAGVTGREAIMNAINGTDADVRSLASTLNADVNEVRSALSTISSGLATVGSQVGMSALQVVNAIQAGNSGLASQLAQCCCENRLLTTQQGYEAQIRTLEQTNALGSQADRNTRSITDAISAQTVAMNDQFCAIKNREYESEISRLRTELANSARAADKAEILGGVNAIVAPLAAQVASIKQSMPPTVAVPYPQLQALPSFNTLELLANLSIVRNIFGGNTTQTPTTTSATA